MIINKTVNKLITLVGVLPPPGDVVSSSLVNVWVEFLALNEDVATISFVVDGCVTILVAIVSKISKERVGSK